MSDVAIKVDGVSKSFKLPHERQGSIKSAFVSGLKRKRTYEKQRVLHDISFEIKQGEFFGIVGRNGSGKSTLLKLLAGIYTPDSGHIQVNGKLTPFIELGVGFNPELTGRENVFLNGALLGFNRSGIEAMYDEIVDFAELEKFMDQKLKNYSSGMQVRLAFSIAIQAKSDILVLDEVLAVGDEAFQNKCIKIFDSYKKNKQTVVLVTHDMETVKKYCTDAILISDGKILNQGKPHAVANSYSQLNQEQSDKQPTTPTPHNPDLQIKIMGQDVSKIPHYQYSKTMRVQIKWSPKKTVDTVGVAIYSSLGECIYATNTNIDGVPINNVSLINYNVNLKLGGGNYFLAAGTFIGKENKIVDFISDGPNFIIDNEEIIKGEGLTRLEHDWQRSEP